jgi:glycerophosphoryl diester phosphodiesterase
MNRSVLITLALLPLAAGCAATPATPEGPILADYFDCVRERGVAVSAHRGQSTDSHPENSIVGILETGRSIPGAIVEIDAVLTSDGHLVLMHDDTVNRTTTGRGRVSDLTLAEIKATQLVNPQGVVVDAAPPTLGEALEAARTVGAIASIDLKPASEAATMVLARAVVAEVRRLDAQGRVILITYSPETARAVAALAPEMMISAGAKSMSNLEGLNPSQVLGWTGSGRPDPEQWRALKARGVEAQFGTLGAEGRRLDDVYASDGDPSEYRTLYQQGVTVIATDAPMTVSRVLAAEVAAAATCPR